LRQIVPDTSSGDWKNSVTGGRQSGATLKISNENAVADELRQGPQDA